MGRLYNRTDIPPGKRLLPTIRFPFPLGKGLGVRFFACTLLASMLR